MSATQNSQAGRRGFDLTFGIYNQTGPWTDRRRLPWETLPDLLAVHKIGRKEGTCVVPAIFSGGSRKKGEAAKIDVALLDSDTGHTLAEIESAVRRMGYAALISSSYSHMTTRTRAKRTNWERFCAAQQGDTDADSLAFTFLHEEKGYLPHVAEGAFLTDPKPGELKPSEEGQYVFFEHNPCPKFRVVIPLARPWKASDFPAQDIANARWKEAIEALAGALRLGHDQACVDTSRLFYLPRRPENGPMPETAVIEGEDCDIFALEKPAEGLFGAAAAAREKRRTADEQPDYVDPDGEVHDLTAWARTNGLRFEIVAALRARKPGAFVGHLADGVKHHIRCPNEGEHTNAGADGATFITNASEANNKGFVIHCRHGHCGGRDRLFFVRRMLEEGWLSVEDLTKPEFLGQPQDGSGTNDNAEERPHASTRGRRREAPPEIEWPEPIDFLADADLTGAPELLPEHMPGNLHAFCMDTAERMGVDPASVALVALVSCASVITDDWRLQVKRHDTSWTESPRLWGAIVGDPSIKKTPVITACTKPIEHMEAEARKNHADAMRKHKADLKAWKDEGGPECDKPVAPRGVRFLVEGATMEALSEVLRDDEEAKFRASAGKVLVRQDEMSEWVASFDRYGSGKGGGDRGGWLRLYNGGRFSVDRIMRGSFAVPNWSACFVGGIQPGPIQKMAQDATDDGLLQRFCYCVPGRNAAEQDREPDAKAVQGYEELIKALSALRPALNQFGGAGRPVVMAEDAHRHREEVNELATVLAAMPDTPLRLKAAFGKWPGLYARLALVFHLIEHATLGAQAPPVAVLREETAKKAAAYLQGVLLPHLRRADAVMFTTAQTGHAHWIASFILAKAKPVVALRDVVQAYGALRPPEKRRELLEVMGSLEAMGWIRDPDSEPGRAPTRWQVNPAVLTTFAARGQAERERREKAQQEMRDLIARKQGRL